jgi:hypothetical protein
MRLQRKAVAHPTVDQIRHHGIGAEVVRESKRLYTVGDLLRKPPRLPDAGGLPRVRGPLRKAGRPFV